MKGKKKAKQLILKRSSNQGARLGDDTGATVGIAP